MEFEKITTVFDNEEKSFAEKHREELDGHVANMILRSLASAPLKNIVVDHAVGRRPIKAGMLLALALSFSEKMKQFIHSDRVGIVLPPGIPSIVVNLATLFANKIPVNLNFTLGRNSLESSMQIAGIKTVITVDAMRDKLKDFPWPKDTIDFVGVVKRFSKFSLIRRCVLVNMLPGKMLARIYDIPTTGGNKEATLLFTSGSVGEPKGVLLTHRNIIGNVMQILDLLPEVKSGHKLLANLPVFHSFGFTVGMCLPLMINLPLVTCPSPLDVKKNIKAIAEDKPTILLGTPTFLRPYLKRATTEQMSPIKIVVAGAEKAPEDLIQAWEKHFSCIFIEGYGMTEASPIVSLNLLTEKDRRAGSVGRICPGMSARVVDPESGMPLKLGDEGILQIHGVNVFGGYFQDPERTIQVLHKGWFHTGDLARIDQDGFLFIEGRISRFSKIGGEMVPHGTIEEAVVRALKLEEEEKLPLAVTSRLDTTKGEVLVVLNTLPDVTLDSVKQILSDAGFPNLWIPREMKMVPEIPTLLTGKLDIRACREVASRNEDTNASFEDLSS